jgi:cell division protein FtsQ
LARLTLCLKTMAGIGIVTVISLLFILGYDFMTQCDYFRAVGIEVHGAHRLTRELLLRQARIEPGVNVLAVNLAVIRKRLLSHPWIAAAEVSRDLPGEINISIHEHEPLAILDLNRKFLINVQGEVFKELEATDPQDLPLIRGLTFSDLRVPGSPASVAFDAVMEVLHLGLSAESVLPNRLIQTVQVDPEMGLTLEAFDQSKIIKLGYSNYAGKYARLKSVLPYLNRERNLKDFESIDLNNLDRIVLNPKPMDPPVGNHKEV